MLLAWWFGVRIVWVRGSFVFGEVLLPVFSQACISAREYVWPSAVTTGSVKMSCVIGSTKASGTTQSANADIIILILCVSSY